MPEYKPNLFDCILEKNDFVHFLEGISNGSVDLVLTDPPYAISKKTGFKSLGKKSIKRFAVSMDFGAWDQEEVNISKLARLIFSLLRKGGSTIIFYDLWKITKLSDALKEAGFKQLRFIEWLKTNPVPLNSKRNYLTNSREIAILAVKDSKPTFKSNYDNGQYKYPIPNSGKRFHPTQKPLELFKNLILKHSNENDFIVDPFVGSGTTAIACKELNRRFAGCDIDANYIKIAEQRLKNDK